MNCEQVRSLLSAFHDGVLAPAERTAVNSHLSGCAGCCAAVDALTELGDIARALPEPEPPGDLWDRLATRINVAAGNRTLTRGRLGLIVALAATLLLAAVTGWWAVHRPDGDQPPVAQSSPAAVDLGRYLDEPGAGPLGELVSLQEASQYAAFRVASLAEMPDGFAFDRCCLTPCGCCDILECVFRRGRERIILCLYGDKHHVQYGDRPVLEMRVHGKPARIVQGRECLAASWDVNGRSCCLIGPHDLSDLVRLVAHVDQRLAAKE